MGLTEILKDIFDSKINKAIRRFEEDGQMISISKNFPEQILLADDGYISKRITNIEVLDYGVYSLEHYVWTDKGIKFKSIRHPLRYLYTKITGESF